MTRRQCFRGIYVQTYARRLSIVIIPIPAMSSVSPLPNLTTIGQSPFDSRGRGQILQYIVQYTRIIIYAYNIIIYISYNHIIRYRLNII